MPANLKQHSKVLVSGASKYRYCKALPRNNGTFYSGTILAKEVVRLPHILFYFIFTDQRFVYSLSIDTLKFI